jgi:hypothetical protein
MEKWKIPIEAQPFVDALRELISPGIQAATTLELSPLVDLNVVTTKTGPGAPAAARADFFIEELERIIKEKMQGNDRERALCLFALDAYAGIPARKRYEKIASLHDKHATWESYRKEPLDRFLVAVYLKLYREGVKTSIMAAPIQGATSVNDSNPRAARQGFVGGDYIINKYESIYNLPTEPGKPREFLQVRQITATSDGVEAWRQSTRWWNKNVDELPDFTLFGPGKLALTYDARLKRTDKPGRVYVTEVKFPQSLKEGDHAEFAILKSHNVTFEEVVHEGWRDWCGLLGVTIPIENAVESVHFPDAFTPRKVWYFEDLPEWLVPGVASEDNTLIVDSSGFVTHTWRDLLLGHSYGLAWVW